MFIKKERKGRVEEIAGRNRKAMMIRPVEHGEVKIFAEEERQFDNKLFRQAIKKFFVGGKG